MHVDHNVFSPELFFHPPRPGIPLIFSEFWTFPMLIFFKFSNHKCVGAGPLTSKLAVFQPFSVVRTFCFWKRVFESFFLFLLFSNRNLTLFTALYDVAKLCERKSWNRHDFATGSISFRSWFARKSLKKLPPPIAKEGSSSEAFFFLSPPSRIPSLLGDAEILSSSEPFSEWQQDNVSLTFPSFCCRPNFPCFFRSVFYDTPFPLLLLPREKKVFPFVLFLVQKYFFPCQ